MRMAIKKYSTTIFWLVLFLVFFYTPIKKFDVFSVVIEETQGKPVPLIIVLYEFFKFLLIKSRIVALIFSAAMLLLLVVILFMVSFLVSRIFEKTNFFKLKFFLVLNNLIEKFLNIKTIYLLALLFLVSLIPRLVYINAGLFHHDSVETAIATEQTVETGKLHGIVGYRYGYILLNVIAYLVPHFIFGVQSAELTVNILTVITASLSIAIAYLFVKELLNNNYTAFCAALLFSFSSVYFSVTTYAKDHAPSVLFILLAGYCLLKSLKTGLMRYYILLGITLGFSLFIRVADILITIPIFLLLYLFPRKFLEDADNFSKRFEFKNVAFILIPLIIFLILFFFFQKGAVSGSISGNKFLGNESYSNHVLSIITSLTPFVAFLAAYGLFISLRKKHYIALLLFFWILIVYVFYSSFITSKLRFFIPLLIPLFIITSIGLDYIKKHFSIVSYLFLIAAVMSMFLLIKPIMEYRHYHSSGKELAFYVANNSGQNSIIVDSGDFGMFYKYYAKRSFIQCPDKFNSTQFADLIMEMNSTLAHKVPLYFNDRCLDLPSDRDKFLMFDALTRDFAFVPVGDVYIENYESIYVFYKYKFTIYKVKMKSI